MQVLSKTILYADDDPDDRQLLLEALQELDPECILLEASNGAEALQILQQAKENGILPALVLLDINMPVMDGKQTLAAIKKDATLRTIPTVLFSTSSSPSDKLYATHFDVELVIKPTRFKNLAATLIKLLPHSFK
jgi:CheY-like chemotaxis protein